MSPMSTNAAATIPISLNNLGVNRSGFDYPVFDEDNGDGVDVGPSDNDDDTHIETEDQ